MHIRKNSLYNLHFKVSPSVLIACIFLVNSASTLANSIAINHSQLEQYIALTDENVLLKPAGEGVFLSFDLNESWRVKFDYQTWQDTKQATTPVTIELDFVSFGGSLEYTQDTWYAATSIGFSEDDISYRVSQRLTDKRQNNTQVTAISTVVGKSWLSGNWMFDLSLGAQYADWSIENKTFNNDQAQQDGKPAQEITTSGSDSTSVNAGVTVARYWQLSQTQGILVGVLLAWNYQFSGDAELRADNAAPARRSSGQSSSAVRNTSGDDNYGQVMTYLSYDINDEWSVDVDTAVEIATANNNISWSIGLSYTF